MATQSSILARITPTDRGIWRAAIHWGRKESEETERLSIAQYISMKCRSFFRPSLEKNDFFFFGLHNRVVK